VEGVEGVGGVVREVLAWVEILSEVVERRSSSSEGGGFRFGARRGVRGVGLSGGRAVGVRLEMLRVRRVDDILMDVVRMCESRDRLTMFMKA
jgi:hypothetical protein